MKRNILSKIKRHYISMEEELGYEKQFYYEELKKLDWTYLKEAGEIFLIHAYSHRFHISQVAHKLAKKYGADASQFEVFGGDDYKIRYGQFYLNLAIGLELILKSILLKKGERINLHPDKTFPFGLIINNYLSKIFPKLSKTTLDEISDTLKLINLRRNNIVHRSKKSHDSYAHEYRFSYITLYIYESFSFEENPDLTKLLLKSIERSKVTQGSDFRPLRIKPRSLRERKYN